MRTLLLLLLLFVPAEALAQGLRANPPLAEINAMFKKIDPKIDLGNLDDGEPKEGRSYLALVPIAQFEDRPSAGRNEQQIIDAYLKRTREGTGDVCKAFKSQLGPKQQVKAIVFRRVTTECADPENAAVYEAIIAIDGQRYQMFRLGGEPDDRANLAKQIAKLSESLIASYR